jgi:hypothetical protein
MNRGAGWNISNPLPHLLLFNIDFFCGYCMEVQGRENFDFSFFFELFNTFLLLTGGLLILSMLY